MNWKGVAQQHWLQTLKVTGWKSREYNVAVVQPGVHDTGGKSVHCMRWQGPLDGPYLSHCTKTWQKDSVDVDTKISRRLDWTYGVWTRLDDVMVMTGRCTPDVLHRECIQLQSVAVLAQCKNPTLPLKIMVSKLRSPNSSNICNKICVILQY